MHLVIKGLDPNSNQNLREFVTRQVESKLSLHFQADSFAADLDPRYQWPAWRKGSLGSVFGANETHWQNCNPSSRSWPVRGHPKGNPTSGSRSETGVRPTTKQSDQIVSAERPRSYPCYEIKLIWVEL